MRCLISSLMIFAALVLSCGCEGTDEPDFVRGDLADATLNGYVIEDGTVRFDVSMVDKGGSVVTEGEIESASVSELEATGPAGEILSTPTGTATVCGDITYHGDLSAGITLDATGSMQQNDPGRLRRDAAWGFVDRLRPEDEAAVASFETCLAPTPGYYAFQLWQPFTADQSPLKTAVEKAAYNGCGTNLWDAVYDTALMLGSASHPNRAALVLTDGMDNGSQLSLDDAIGQLKARGVRGYVIALTGPGSDCGTINCTDLQRLTSETGGTFALASEAEELEGLFDRMYNALIASGCITVEFAIDGHAPPPGSTITGLLSFSVRDITYSVEFTVVF